MNSDLLLSYSGHAFPKSIREVFSGARLLYSWPEIIRIVDQIAVRISMRLKDRNPIFLCDVEDGGWLFGLLMQRLHFPQQSDYFDSVYDAANGNLVFKREPDIVLENRDVVFVVGDANNGKGLGKLDVWAKNKGAAGVSVAALVNQGNMMFRLSDLYSGFRVEEKTLFGCGLAYLGYGHNLPNLYST